MENLQDFIRNPYEHLYAAAMIAANGRDLTVDRLRPFGKYTTLSYRFGADADKAAEFIVTRDDEGEWYIDLSLKAVDASSDLPYWGGCKVGGKTQEEAAHYLCRDVADELARSEIGSEYRIEAGNILAVFATFFGLMKPTPDDEERDALRRQDLDDDYQPPPKENLTPKQLAERSRIKDPKTLAETIWNAAHARGLGDADCRAYLMDEVKKVTVKVETVRGSLFDSSELYTLTDGSWMEFRALDEYLDGSVVTDARAEVLRQLGNKI